MENTEMAELTKKVLKAVLITILICAPLFIYFINRYKTNPTTLYDSINKKESFIVYVYESDSYDKKVTKKIENKNIIYYEYNIEENRDDLKRLTTSLNITEDNIRPWCVIYVKKGKMSSNINIMNDLDGFLKNIK